MRKKPQQPDLARSGLPASFFRALQQELEPLKQLPAHGNRKLHLHPLVLTLVASFYDPMIRSLRDLEARSVSKPILPQMDLQRMARSSTSDALRAFDPQLLQGVIKNLQKQLPHLKTADQRFDQIAKKIVAADGSYFSTFADVAWALGHTKTNGRRQAQVRLNFQIAVLDWSLQQASISGQADGSEPDAFSADLLSDVLYVVDRNFLDFDFIKALLAKDNDLVLRIRRNAPRYQVMETRKTTAKDQAAGVISDQLVKLSGQHAPAGTFRLVQLQHASDPDQRLWLLTSLRDASIAAWLIGQIYQQRWQIELFFRWLKLWCNFDHLLSSHRDGISLQFYCMMIATLLMHIHQGRRLSKYTLLAMRQIALGLATPQQMQWFLARRDREHELARQRAAAKKV